MDAPATTQVLRRLSAEESPLPGDLLSGEPLCVWTDAALWRDHPAWRAHPDGHLLAPIDAGRDARGRGVIVPHCPHRLSASLSARLRVEPGEAVTIAVSLLRGALEADELGIARGEWWLTSEGRPVLAAASEGPSWRGEADEILAALSPDREPALTAALDAARAALADPRMLRRRGDEIEAQLFDAAEPRPVTQIAGALSARALAGHTAHAPLPVDGVAVPRSRREPRRSDAVHALITRHVDGEWADRIREAWDACRDRLRPASPKPATPPGAPTRRRAVLVGAGAAVLVLAVGLSLPQEEPDARAAAHGGVSSPAAATSPTVRAEPASSPSAPTADPEDSEAKDHPPTMDPEADATAVVELLSACAAAGCPATVVESPGAPLAPGAATTPHAERRVELIDDYGGVAAVRVSAEDAGDQVVVLVRVDEKWLVRDVYDVADQPGG